MLIPVMVTIDRSAGPAPGPNYLAETLASLARSDLKTYPDARLLVIVDNSPAGISHTRSVVRESGLSSRVVIVDNSAETRPDWNVAAALQMGAVQSSDPSSDWVLFMEDDIQVCGDFLASVAGWLSMYGHPDDHHVYSFGAAYPPTDTPSPSPPLGETGAWEYPVSTFYGTQCFALCPHDAESLASYLRNHALHHGAYDISMHDWAARIGCDCFLASRPSFVQHIGTQSQIRKGAESFGFPSWPGESWSYSRLLREESRT